jgi:hypothetical protein
MTTMSAKLWKSPVWPYCKVALIPCGFKPNLERVANDNSAIYTDDHEFAVITAAVPRIITTSAFM